MADSEAIMNPSMERLVGQLCSLHQIPTMLTHSILPDWKNNSRMRLYVDKGTTTFETGEVTFVWI